jgi:hypothetical protein
VDLASPAVADEFTAQPVGSHLRITFGATPFSEGSGPFPSSGGLGTCTNDLHAVNTGTFKYTAEIRRSNGTTCQSIDPFVVVGPIVPTLGAAGLAGLLTMLAIAGVLIMRRRRVVK